MTRAQEIREEIEYEERVLARFRRDLAKIEAEEINMINDIQESEDRLTGLRAELAALASQE